MTAKARINVALDPDVVNDLDERVLAGEFSNRSEAIASILDDGMYEHEDDEDEDDDDDDD